MSKSKETLRRKEIALKAEQAFGSAEAARTWLRTHNLMLGGTPLALIRTETGAEQVKRVLRALTFGGTA